MAQTDWAAHAALVEGARRSAEQAEQTELDATAALTRGRGELELLSESIRTLPARNRELRTNVQLLREALDRAKLSALNAGLEGARLGDPVGRALVDLAGDLRDLLGRAVGTLEEHGSLLGELERERERERESLTTARTALAASGESLGRAQALRRDLSRAISELERQVSAELGADPETTRLIASATDQAQALRQTLTSLVASGAGETARELLGPLAAALGDTDKSEKT
jgi:methyl-accepting chemotaxis protein